MKRRSRTRRVLRWAATVTAVAALTVFLVSFWLQLVVTSPHGFAYAVLGQVCTVWAYPRDVGHDWDTEWGVKVTPAVAWDQDSLSQLLLPTWVLSPAVWILGLPLWPFVVLPALLSFWLWRRERRLPGPGHCHKCGYNLTGNVSGVYPECGEAT